MRILIVARDYGRHVLKECFRHDDGSDQIRRVTLDKAAHRDLAGHLERLGAARYDRVVIALKARWILSQADTLARYHNLVIHEPSTWFNFDPINPLYGRFSDLYHRLPPFTLVVTSYSLARAWRAEGLHATCVPKSYDPESLGDDAGTRDLRLGFVGRTRQDPYPRRRRVLSRFQTLAGMPVLECHDIPGYRRLLNRIRFFISADVGMKEYMQKNFEALACGCVLVAWQQGDGEEEALGLVDGENCLLYRDVDDVLVRIAELERQPDTVARIAAAGRALAAERFTHPNRDRALFDAIRGPLPVAHEDLRGYWARLRSSVPYSLRGHLARLPF